MKQLYFLKNKFISHVFSIFLFPDQIKKTFFLPCGGKHKRTWGLRGLLLFSLWGLGGSLFAQISQPFPDNVYTTDCYAIPQNTVQWSMCKKDSSRYYSEKISSIAFVGDIDNDGRNEVIATGQDSACIIILDYRLNEKFIIRTSTQIPYDYSIAVADVDNDRIAEIFVVTTDDFLTSYNYSRNNVTTKWRIDLSPLIGPFRRPAIADINADGIPDLLISNKIYNAVTGELEVILPDECSVLADADNDGILEAIRGDKVLKVNINNAHGTTGNNAYVWKDIIEQLDGIPFFGASAYASVADIDLDGYLDVISRASRERYGDMYFWKPYTGSNSLPIVCGHFRGFNSSLEYGGTPLVSDLNGNGYPEITWMSLISIYAASRYPTTYGMVEIIWYQPAGDFSEARFTAFDFNQDEKSEIIYCDKNNLKILDGTTGQELSFIPCLSKTIEGYPVVVDLGKDGITTILISENNELNTASRICTYTSVDSSWAPARSVWNQYMYNAVHINEDLTVPQYQFNPVTTFTHPTTGVVRRPFNHFLQQVGPINQYGEPFIPLADVTFIEDSTQTTSCQVFQVKVLIQNLGARKLNAPFPVTIYKDAYGGSVVRQDVSYVPVDTGESRYLTLRFTQEELASFLPITNLVIALNSTADGIAQNGNLQAECDTTNNIIIIPFKPIDSVYRIDLNDTICQGNPYVGNGFDIPSGSTNYSGTKTFIKTYTSMQGCDSIVYLKLQANPIKDTTLNDTICQYEIYNKNGFSLPTQFTVGAFTHRLDTITTHNCDSIIYLNLTVIQDTTFNSIFDTVIQGRTYEKHGFTIYIPIQKEEGDYQYQLVSINQWGCYSVINLNLHVSPYLKPALILPNAFTPNKNTNTYFSTVYKQNIKDLKIQIYSRWGEMVFQSSNINFKWDGRDLKGSLVPAGAYVYLIEYHSQTDPNIAKQKKGSVNVVY